jgi:hypothetical protein
MLSGVAGFALGRETPVFMGTDGFNEFSADRQHDVRRGQELLHSRAHEAAPEVQWIGFGHHALACAGGDDYRVEPFRKSSALGLRLHGTTACENQWTLLVQHPCREPSLQTSSERTKNSLNN